MRLVNNTDFLERTQGGRPCMMDTSIYHGYAFKCSCGKTHKFNSNSTIVAREISRMRLILVCPENAEYIACVKLKGWFRFKGFEFLFGTRLKKDFFATNTPLEVIDTKTYENSTSKKNNLNDFIVSKINTLNTFDDYKLLVSNTVDSLAIRFEEVYNVTDNDKLYIVLANLFAKYSDNLIFNEHENKMHNELLLTILVRYEGEDYRTKWDNFIDSTNYFSNQFTLLNLNNKEFDKVIFIVSGMFSSYLFPEKHKHNLIAETLSIIEWNTTIGILAKYQKEFYN